MNQIMNIAYLLIGGNLGNRSANLQKAIQLIEQNCGQIVQLSAIYETAAWGLTDQPSFYNQAIKLQTHLAPDLLMQTLLDIEIEMGRIRTIKLGPRIIDLDMLFTTNKSFTQIYWSSLILLLHKEDLPYCHLLKLLVRCCILFIIKQLMYYWKNAPTS